MVAPLLGELLAQESERVDAVVALATEQEPGAVGAVAIKTVVVAVLVPFAFVAVRVYTVVEVGATVIEPDRVDVVILPGEMVIVVVEVTMPFTFQDNVDVPDEAMEDGDAVNEEMIGDEDAEMNVAISAKRPNCVEVAPPKVLE